MPDQAACEDWVGTAYAGKRLGYSQVTIWRLIQSGDLPSMRAGKDFRLPGQLVEDAYNAVMAGGSIDLAAFAREWSARRAESAEAVVLEEFGRRGIAEHQDAPAREAVA